MKQIERKQYMSRLEAYKDKHVIKVITGVRRCGKSTLLKMFRDRLLSSGISENQIIFANLEDYDNERLLSAPELYKYVKEHKFKKGTTYLFLDEIQNVEHFQKAIDSLFLDEQIDIYITGSNAYLLSGELATLLSGRYITIDMLPFSLKEFIEINSNGTELSQIQWYNKYLQVGSFPYASAFSGDSEGVREYLLGIYNTIIVKDVVARQRISDTKMLESIIRFIFDSIGSPLSSKKIADTLVSIGRKTDSKTVEKYIKGLQESFIIYEAKRYDIKGKQYLKLFEKYYIVDIGLRSMLLGQKSTDVGHILENVVYLELIRRKYKVFVGKMDETEVDFVAQDKSGNTYIQVSASVRDSVTLERELRPLRLINDSYPKILLTLDEDPTADYDGIKRMNALEWLLS